MSELISGKEALIALANGEVVQYNWENNPSREWMDVNEELREFSLHEIMVGRSRHGDIKLRLKPRTITINGIEVPAPFNGDLSHKQYAYVLNTASPDGYGCIKFYEGNAKPLACWICEDEIKQVVSALRSVFKPQ